MKKRIHSLFMISIFILTLVLSGCAQAEYDSAASRFGDEASPGANLGSDSSSGKKPNKKNNNKTDNDSSSSASSSSSGEGTRDNTSVVLTPTASGDSVFSNSVASIDYSNASEGYIMVKYFGSSKYSKIRITTPDKDQYYYNLTPGADYVALPLLSNGSYTFEVFESAGDSSKDFYHALDEKLKVKLTNTFGPFLYPNQYVNFSKNDKCVSKAADLASGCDTDLQVVEKVYNYVIENVTYDFDKAANVQSNYLPVPDETLKSKKGICFDYAALMCSMLRSQGIPTRLEIGYCGTAYHAWLSTYLEDIGWVSGVIYFDGSSWSLMDPTYAANHSSKSVKKYVGDGSNYSLKYMY